MSISSDLKLCSDMAYRLSLATKLIDHDLLDGVSGHKLVKIYLDGIGDCLRAVEAWFEVLLEQGFDGRLPDSVGDGDFNRDELMSGGFPLNNNRLIELPLRPEADSNWGVL